jgi:hypothetical protein
MGFAFPTPPQIRCPIQTIANAQSGRQVGGVLRESGRRGTGEGIGLLDISSVEKETLGLRSQLSSLSEAANVGNKHLTA